MTEFSLMSIVLNPGSTLPKNGFTPFNYVMIITDDATRFRWVYGLLTREHEEIAEKLRQWAAHIKAQGFSMPAFYRSDNEFGSGLIMGLLTSWGSKFEPSNPDSPGSRFSTLTHGPGRTFSTLTRRP
jgi:hypothetical protein